MPLYEYKCRSCEIDFEALVLTISQLGQIDCPKCQSKEVELQVSTFAFKFRDNPLGPYRGDCSKPYNNLTLQHVRDEDGKPITVHSLKELRAAELKYGFVHAVTEDDAIDLPPQNETWAGDIRHDYRWKWTPPEDRNDFSSVDVGPAERRQLLVEG
jgi:putative FmdB family regulatory protein